MLSWRDYNPFSLLTVPVVFEIAQWEYIFYSFLFVTQERIHMDPGWKPSSQIEDTFRQGGERNEDLAEEERNGEMKVIR